jgi:transposase-like protein
MPVPKGSKKQELIQRKENNILEVWKMKVEGHTCVEIGRKLKIPSNTINDWVRQILEERAQETEMLSKNFLEEELAVLEKMQKLLMRDMDTSIQVHFAEDKKGKVKKFLKIVDRVDPLMLDRMLKVQERRSKYRALDKPVVVEHTADKSLAALILDSKQPTLLEPPKDATIIDVEVTKVED